MKANELMVGDWVKLDFYDVPYCDEEEAVWKNGKITAIHHGNWVDVNFGDPLDECDIEVEDIRPIPITPEILKKNGFKEILFDENGKESDNGHPSEIYRYDTARSGYIIELGIYSPNCICIQWKEFGIDGWETGELASFVKEDGSNYMVHELQHALRLCGIEKEIEL